MYKIEINNEIFNVTKRNSLGPMNGKLSTRYRIEHDARSGTLICEETLDKKIVIIFRK